jgi:hypothetical protein
MPCRGTESAAAKQIAAQTPSAEGQFRWRVVDKSVSLAHRSSEGVLILHGSGASLAHAPGRTGDGHRPTEHRSGLSSEIRTDGGFHMSPEASATEREVVD